MANCIAKVKWFFFGRLQTLPKLSKTAKFNKKNHHSNFTRLLTTKKIGFFVEFKKKKFPLCFNVTK